MIPSFVRKARTSRPIETSSVLSRAPPSLVRVLADLRARRRLTRPTLHSASGSQISPSRRSSPQFRQTVCIHAEKLLFLPVESDVPAPVMSRWHALAAGRSVSACRGRNAHVRHCRPLSQGQDAASQSSARCWRTCLRSSAIEGQTAPASRSTAAPMTASASSQSSRPTRPRTFAGLADQPFRSDRRGGDDRACSDTHAVLSLPMETARAARRPRSERSIRDCASWARATPSRSTRRSATRPKCREASSSRR